MTDDYTNAPTARDDELDLLACVLMGWDPTDVDLKPDEFDQPKHETVWKAMLTVAQSGGVPDPSSVRLALGSEGDKAAAWLLEVFGRPVAPANAPAFAARIRRAHQLRSIMELARGMMTEAGKDDANPDAIKEHARARLEQTATVGRATETFADILPRVIDQLESGEERGLSTPWPDLDAKIGGLAPGEVTIVAARPGVGKTLLAQNLGWHWAHHHGQAVSFANIEMTAEALTKRTLSQVAKVQQNDLRAHALTEELWGRINRATRDMVAAPFHICTDSIQTVDSIRNTARSVKRRHGLGLLLVDYLQIVTPRSRGLSREQQVAEVSRGLKVLAKELEVPVVALSQLRRLNDGERNRRPGLTDLRESGSIEQDADNVLILHIPDDDDTPWEAEMLIAKARHGERGMVEMLMRTHFATIQQATRRIA